MSTYVTTFRKALARRVEDLGGLFNAHLHLDRAGTYEATLQLLQQGLESSSALSLSTKHSLIPLIHANECYQPDRLESRVDSYVARLIAAGTTRADTLVDVTTDQVGLQALERCLRIKHRYSDKIDFRVGAYTPLGFRDDEPSRWSLIEKGAIDSDFIGSLPERDDQSDYPSHVGFEESCRRVLRLSAHLQKPVHIHVDQKNLLQEAGSECIVRLMQELGMCSSSTQEPLVWLVHVISPSTYDERRFRRLVDALAELNVGVICCPSAAISMRQVRDFSTPTHNSIARILEMLAVGVHVRVGSDNIEDITSPAGTTDLLDEIFVLSNALRYYDLDVLAHLAGGLRLPGQLRDRVASHLVQDAKEVAAVLDQYQRSGEDVKP